MFVYMQAQIPQGFLISYFLCIICSYKCEVGKTMSLELVSKAVYGMKLQHQQYMFYVSRFLYSAPDNCYNSCRKVESVITNVNQNLHGITGRKDFSAILQKNIIFLRSILRVSNLKNFPVDTCPRTTNLCALCYFATTLGTLLFPKICLCRCTASFMFHAWLLSVLLQLYA